MFPKISEHLPSTDQKEDKPATAGPVTKGWTTEDIFGKGPSQEYSVEQLFTCIMDSSSNPTGRCELSGHYHDKLCGAERRIAEKKKKEEKKEKKERKFRLCLLNSKLFKKSRDEEDRKTYRCPLVQANVPHYHGGGTMTVEVKDDEVTYTGVFKYPNWKEMLVPGALAKIPTYRSPSADTVDESDEEEESDDEGEYESGGEDSDVDAASKEAKLAHFLSNYDLKVAEMLEDEASANSGEQIKVPTSTLNPKAAVFVPTSTIAPPRGGFRPCG
jgi:hypothetical protein